MRALISTLHETVETLLRKEPQGLFELGMTEITVTAETSPLSPVTGSIDQATMRNLYVSDLAGAVPYLPGVSVDHNSARGQSGVMIRGFDSRQVGLYLDGLPVYVPFDGFADIDRFLTSDIALIEVAKGYSSPFLGPNGLGGAVNLVTRRPEKTLDIDASMGTGSGQKLESGLHLGSRLRHFFFQAGMDWLQTGYFPVSAAFSFNALQPGPERVNSYRRDASYSGRLGWEPGRTDQYVLTYHNQKGDYGAPPYSGIDPQNNKPKFWQWPYWDKESYYFNSNTGLGEASTVRLRAFFDRYKNSMTGFSGSTYSRVISAAPYDDHTQGAAAEFSTRTLERQAIGASFFLKGDIHKEAGVSYKNDSAVVEPWRTHRDRIISIGLQNIITLSSRMRATVGLSADHLSAVEAQDLQTTSTGSGKNTSVAYSVIPFSCPGSGSCLNSIWDFNPLASLSYSIAENGTLYFSFARKSHFPTLKDRYSYKYGKAIPNPMLKPEHARNWSLGYARVLGTNTFMQFDLFRSDVSDAIQNAIVPAQYEGQCPNLGSGNCQQSVNVGKEIHQGVEFTIRSSPASLLTLDANYSFLNWTVSGPSNMLGVHPTRAPKHRLLGSITLRMPRRIMILATARYESGTVTTNDSGIVIPASKFATADLGVIAPIRRRMTLHAGIWNLFDRDYYYREGFPEAGRTWHMLLRYNL